MNYKKYRDLSRITKNIYYLRLSLLMIHGHESSPIKLIIVNYHGLPLIITTFHELLRLKVSQKVQIHYIDV